jgi:phenylacetate-CoA ligase
MASWAEKVHWNCFLLWNMRKDRIIPYLPLGRVLELQSRRVRQMIRHAYETVPYYREAMDQRKLTPSDFRTAADLDKLPILMPEQVSRNPRHFRSSSFPGGQTVAMRSSGTSGRFREIHYDRQAMFLSLAHSYRQRAVMRNFVGNLAGYREMVCARPGSISFTIREFFENYSWIPRRLELTRAFLSPQDPFKNNIEKLSQFHPTVLTGYGSYLGAMYRHAWEHNLNIHAPRAIRYGGDAMSHGDRDLLEQHYRIPVLSGYQAAEALRIGFQCERREGFHLSLDLVAVRVIDDRGKAVEPGGQGNIILSNLTNRATVLLNYRQGDVVSLSTSTCPCGRTLPMLASIDGRSDDFLIYPEDGHLLHSLGIQARLHRVRGVIQVQIVQAALRDFRIRAVCEGPLDWEETARGLHEAMVSVFGPAVEVSVERVDQIPPESNGKIKAAICRCKPN